MIQLAESSSVLNRVQAVPRDPAVVGSKYLHIHISIFFFSIGEP